MLVALVQSVVSPFHENPGPLHERGCEETGERANKDFLEEGRVHPFLTATMVPVSKLFAEDADPAIAAKLRERGTDDRRDQAVQ